jgi:hypothetical protein
MDRPKTWSELNEALFAGSWNPALQRFRSPYAFRGLGSTTHELSNSLVRLAAGQASINTLELSLLRNFSKYAHWQPAHGVESSGTGSRSASITDCRPASSTGRIHPLSPSISSRSIPMNTNRTASSGA